MLRSGEFREKIKLIEHLHVLCYLKTKMMDISIHKSRTDKYEIFGTLFLNKKIVNDKFCEEGILNVNKYCLSLRA